MNIKSHVQVTQYKDSDLGLSAIAVGFICVHISQCEILAQSMESKGLDVGKYEVEMPV